MKHRSLAPITGWCRNGLKATVVCGLLAIVPVTGHALTHSASEAVPRSESSWSQRQAAFNQAVAAAPSASLVFLGDSLTEGWVNTTYTEHGFEIWRRYYEPRQALNLGLGGDRTEHLLWRIRHGNLAGLHPKVIVLLAGANNATSEAVSVLAIIEGVYALVHELRLALPDTRILLVGLLPAGEFPNARRGNLLQANQSLCRLADNQHVYWLDFGARFIRHDNTIGRELMWDQEHLTPAGYQIWAQEMEPLLARLLGDQPVAPPR